MWTLRFDVISTRWMRIFGKRGGHACIRRVQAGRWLIARAANCSTGVCHEEPKCWESGGLLPQCLILQCHFPKYGDCGVIKKFENALSI
jgi:hypothetical protein